MIARVLRGFIHDGRFISKGKYYIQGENDKFVLINIGDVLWWVPKSKITFYKKKHPLTNIFQTQEND